MSNVCPGCQKFASLELEEPEVNDLDVDQETGEITGEIRVYLISGCCSEEMKEYNFSMEIEPPEDLAEHIQGHKDRDEKYELTVEENGIEADDYFQNKDRHGKPIKSYRYMRHYYGYTGQVTITCSCDELEAFDVDISEYEQASAFDELNY